MKQKTSVVVRLQKLNDVEMKTIEWCRADENKWRRTEENKRHRESKVVCLPNIEIVGGRKKKLKMQGRIFTKYKKQRGAKQDNTENARSI